MYSKSKIILDHVKQSAYIESSWHGFTVCNTHYMSRTNRIETRKSGAGRNIFGESLHSYEIKDVKHETVIIAGDAISRSFKTESEAREYIKNSGLIETYGPHTVISVDR